ncbi:hypothetical protein KJ980_02120 [Patescibacteria group bacterium]|nr:hypothetical protein [Patescibacteria group bacterium]MBU4016245.1 hypothetical protein [Patescibacteria group bacterium]MBU4098426.1 hypothetical protein [Patescibacteria group bacterium]
MKDLIVVKIGSSVFITRRNKIDEFRIDRIAKQIVALQKEGIGIVLIISGAVAYGSSFIDLSGNRHQLRQAAAGIGQIYTTCTFNSIFAHNNLQLAQILLTKDYLKRETQSKKIRNIIEFYVNAGFIPFINENDVVDLNSFGGNDLLAAEIAGLLKSKKLLILSTMKGSIHGVGGGATKQEAIEILFKKHIEATIINGKTKDILLQALL